MKRPVRHGHIGVLGYADPWQSHGGRQIALRLACGSRVLHARLRRLDCDNAEIKDWPVRPAGADGTGQEISLGSFFCIHGSEIADGGQITAVEFEVMQTKNAGCRFVLECGDCALVTDGARLFVRLRGAAQEPVGDLPPGKWATIAVEATRDTLHVRIATHDRAAGAPASRSLPCKGNPLRGDVWFATDKAQAHPTFNGRFARPRLTIGDRQFAWTFPIRFTRSPLLSHEGKAQLIIANDPTFCVRSRRWDGSSFEPRLVPAHYDAIHFHEDDAGAFEWQATLTIDIPRDAESGIYACEVTTASGSESIEFFVLPRRPAAKLLFVVPTATYLAYANEDLPDSLYPWKCDDRGHRAARENGLKSLYDFHADESGVSITSWRKPKMTLREDYRYPLCGCPHNLPVDLQLLRFCRRNGVEIDVTTDHAVHRLGPDAFDGYRGVVTGSHPEYLSVEMEAAYRLHVEGGGHLAYLGGNGFAGVVALEEDVMELRRSPLEANRTWDGAIAEQTLAITNEPGGPMRARGRGEFGLVGVAMSLMGFEKGLPYRRTPASYDAEYEWLFKGVAQAQFGNSGSVLDAVAGYEVDATDPHLGSPEDIVILAEASGFPAGYISDPARWYAGGEAERNLRSRAEMTLRPHPSGGIVFAASSVAWCGALPATEDMNDVGQITLNLLRRFAAS